MARRQTWERRLWTTLFGPKDVPRLDPQKVHRVIQSLPDERERQAILLRFGFQGGTVLSMRKVGNRIARVDGTIGVSRAMARYLVAQGLRHLKHPSRRHTWEEAKR